MTIEKKMRIPDGSSVFTAEAKAIDLALDFVNTCTYTDKFVIFSDSLSVLQALNYTSSKNSQIEYLLLKHHEISSSKTIIYRWIPSHIGKSESNPHLLKQNFHEVQSYYSDHEHIYTDGSKDEEKVGCAAAKYDDCKKNAYP